MAPDAASGSTAPGEIPGGAAPTSGADMVGTVLAGRYRILKLLGEGAMGAVYLAEHIRIGRQDAIKVLRGPMARDPEAIARFTRGARNVSAIHHPNVCAIYDFSDTSDGLQFMAMEYVPGATLKDVLESEGTLAPVRAAWMAKQVADALQAAHEVDIVHRDLKPGNIMVARAPDGRDRVKVVDFDIAKGPRDGEASEVTRLGFVVGTPEYMSPEQLMGERLDGRSDVYSLALVLFRALTGTLPFQADDVQGLALKRLTDSPLRLDQVAPGHAFPPGLQDVLSRGLERRAADRYQSAADFGRDVMAAVEGTLAPGRPGAAPRAGAAGTELPATRIAAATAPPAPAAGGQRSRRALYAGAAAIVVAAAAGTGLWVSSRHDTASAAQADSVQAQQAPPPLAAGDSAHPAPAPPATPTPRSPVAARDGGSGGTPANGGSTSPARPAGGEARPAGGGETAAVPGIAIAPADAKTVLDRQMDAIALAAGPLDAATLRAIGDTAQAVWGTGASAANRAFAAYIMGNVRSGLGDRAGAVTWLKRAVSLNPGERGYQQMLDGLQKGSP